MRRAFQPSWRMRIAAISAFFCLNAAARFTIPRIAAPLVAQKTCVISCGLGTTSGPCTVANIARNSGDLGLVAKSKLVDNNLINRNFGSAFTDFLKWFNNCQSKSKLGFDMSQ